MAGLGRARVSLRVFGDDLEPDEITKLLGCAPTSAGRKAEARQGGAERTYLWRTGSWLLSIDDCAPGDLDVQIKALLATVTDDLGVWRDILGRYRCDLFCGLFMSEGNEGAELEPETLEMLGARGLRLDLDIYGPTED